MFYYILTGLINAIASTILGFLVYSRNKKSTLNKSFALFCLSVALWSWAYCFWPGAQDQVTALFWFRALHIGAIFIPVTYIHFILTFLGLAQKKKKFLIFSYLTAFIFCIFDFTPLFIRDMVPKFSFRYWAEPGILYHFFLLMFFSYTSYCWYLLYKARKRFSGVRRLQINYVLTGTLIGFIGGSTNYFLWYNIPIPPLGNGLVSLYVILTAVAILKYHLFEVKVLLTELLVGGLGLILLIQAITAQTFQWKVLNSSTFFVFFLFGYYLIRATYEETKRREEAERLVKEFARLDRAKNQFILSTQHHLRTPLSIMKGYLSLMLGETYGKLNKKSKEKLRFMQKANQRLINLVNDFLDITQFQLGKEILNKKEAQIEDLIEEVVKELKPEAEEKKIYLRFKKPKTSSPKLNLDPEKLKEAIFNVVDNGIKYTNQGGVIINIQYPIPNIQYPESKIQILIKDTGIGMTKEEAEEVLNRFFERGKKAKEVYTTGRGIGLYIANQIIKAHQGKIWAESEGKSKGSTFYIELSMK